MYKKYSLDEKSDNVFIPACRKCSSPIMDAWNAIKEKQGTGSSIYKCRSCETSNEVFMTREAYKSNREVIRTDPDTYYGNDERTVALQWDDLDDKYKYNTRKNSFHK